MSKSRARTATVAALCATEFAALGALVIPAIVGLQLRVAELDSDLSPESRLSWVTTCGAIAAMLAGPVGGWLSDRSARRHGHRAWWIIGGAGIGLTSIMTAAYAPTLALLVLAWVVAQASYGATFVALFASLSDFVPEADRPRVVGLFAGSGLASVAFAGAFAAALLDGRLGPVMETPSAVFIAMAAIALPPAALTGWHLRRLGRAAGPAVGSPRAESRGVLQALGGAGTPFWWLLAQRFLVQMAYSCLTVYAVFYLVRRTGESMHDAAVLVGAATAIGGSVGMAVSGGGARFLARRLGYRSALSLGIVLLLAATVVMGVSATKSAFVVAHVLAGAGLGTYLALDLVVALKLLPSSTAGRLLGYFTMVRKVPQSLVPAIGPALLAIGSGDVIGVDRSSNYFALLAFGSLMAVAAMGLAGRLAVPD